VRTAARARIGRRSYNRPISRFYSIDDANALVPELVVVIGASRPSGTADLDPRTRTGSRRAP
jgi:hypothetical protein